MLKELRSDGALDNGCRCFKDIVKDLILASRHKFKQRLNMAILNDDEGPQSNN